MLDFMKKNIFGALFIFALVSSLISCNFTFSGSEYSDKPGVEAIDKIITLSIPYQSDTTKYINVYRKDVNDKTDTDVNIGLLYTSSYDTKSAYTFFDKMIVKNHTYKYRVRYSDVDGYTYSEWSDEITAKDGYIDSSLLKYQANNAVFYLNDGDYSLKISGEILPPQIENFDTEYNSMLIVSNGTKTEVFKLESLANDTVIALRGRLPEDFIDVEITILGIVAQKSDIDSTDDPTVEIQPKAVHWIEPTEIEVFGFKNNKFTIPSIDGKDGLDYSKKID